MAASSGLPKIEQGRELEWPLDESAVPNPTWKSLAHSDSTASIDAEENILTDRVDSVALAHMRLNKLHKANDSITVARKRISGQSSGQGGADQDDFAEPPSDGTRGGAPDLKRESPSLTAGLKKLSGALRKGLRVVSSGNDNSGSQQENSKDLSSSVPSGSSPRVRFSVSDDARVDD